jgi:hypothetical protein
MPCQWLQPACQSRLVEPSSPTFICGSHPAGASANGWLLPLVRLGILGYDFQILQPQFQHTNTPTHTHRLSRIVMCISFHPRSVTRSRYGHILSLKQSQSQRISLKLPRRLKYTMPRFHDNRLPLDGCLKCEHVLLLLLFLHTQYTLIVNKHLPDTR